MQNRAKPYPITSSNTLPAQPSPALRKRGDRLRSSTVGAWQSVLMHGNMMTGMHAQIPKVHGKAIQAESFALDHLVFRSKPATTMPVSHQFSNMLRGFPKLVTTILGVSILRLPRINVVWGQHWGPPIRKLPCGFGIRKLGRNVHSWCWSTRLYRLLWLVLYIYVL